MQINQLPDECILHILTYINDLDDAINCLKVCYRWSQLMIYRLSKVKYLEGVESANQPGCYWDKLFYHRNTKIHGVDLSSLLTSLKIADLDHTMLKKLYTHELIKLLTTVKTIKGVNFEPRNLISGMNYNCMRNLDMLGTSNLDYYLREAENGNHIQQLVLTEYYVYDYANHAKYFKHLKRLRIENCDGLSDGFYDGPVLKNLEILELGLSTQMGGDQYVGFHFMDRCPALKSAWHHISEQFFYIDTSIKNYNLEDLVLCVDFGQSWDSLQKLLSKYPNLKHLALKKYVRLKEIHLRQIVSMLPKLRLLDVRESSVINQKDIDEFCQQNNRNVKIYSKPFDNQIFKDWPNFSTTHERISRGFNFMKNCFFKPFAHLPKFLDPLETDGDNDDQ